VSIQPRHCRFEFTADERILLIREQSEPDHICVNGISVESEVLLEHNDRIIIGTNTVFILKHPAIKNENSKNDLEVDFDFAIQERMDTNMKTEGYHDELEKIKNEAEARLAEQRAEYEKRL
jgi:hypothetical protein